MLRNSGSLPVLPAELGGHGKNDAGASSIRSGGSARSRIPLSARSAASAISMHVNSYSYLSNRVYDFLQARSAWLRRAQYEKEEGGDTALKRLPADFEPFFAVDTKTRKPDSSSSSRSCSSGGSVSTTQDERGRETGSRAADLAFRVSFAVFSSRHWDRLYLFLGLAWSVLCPGYMDGAIPIERAQLALLLQVMFAAACAPTMLAAVHKFFFSVRLRSRLLHDDSKHFVGVFFVLATKALSVPALCGSGRLCERRVHALTEDDRSSDDVGRHYDLERGASKIEGTSIDGAGEEEGMRRAPLGGGRDNGAESSSRPTTPLGREKGKDGTGVNRSAGDPRRIMELDLPPRHWMCIVCKKVNKLPDDWTGRAGKVIKVVIKRKEVDRQAMYGVFKARPGVPLCRKCETPFNYAWRNGGDPDQSAQQRRQLQLLEAALSRPATAASTGAGSAGTPVGAEGGEDGNKKKNRGIPLTVFASWFTKAVGFVHALVSPSRRRRDKNKLIDAGGSGGAGGRGGGDDNTTLEEPELWYGREFRRQLTTYFKPELDRPSLSSSQARGGGGRFPIGARVACFAGKGAWYPGAVTASRENNTYDVRYDNGDIAQHVFPHMIRFEPTRADSRLLRRYYGLALTAAAGWPLTGFWYFSSAAAADATAADATADAAVAIVALPALVVGAAGVIAVAVQFWEIYAENKNTGMCIPAKFAAIFALPALSLAVVGGLAVAKALDPVSAGSWVQMLLVPSILFSITGGGYAHAVSPAYGKAWAAASPPWLLFLLLVTLRLDGERGDASPAFGRMRWLGVYFPLWVFLLMLIAAHQALPYVWDMDVFPPPPPPVQGEGGGDGEGVKGWPSRLVSRFVGGFAAALATRREKEAETAAAAAAAAAAVAVAADVAAAGGGDDSGAEVVEDDGPSDALPAATSTGGGEDDDGQAQIEGG